MATVMILVNFDNFSYVNRTTSANDNSQYHNLHLGS